MVFGDILMMYQTLLLRPLPSCILEIKKVLRNKHVSKELKILFRWRDLAGLKFFQLKRGDLGG
jgi:hypothetical protein